MGIEDLSVAALWWAVIISGFYHGVNPGMGWPLAVSAALMERDHRALPKALGLLALGHFLSMLAILLPFSVMLFLVDWELQIRMGAGLIVVAMGIYLLVNRRHPRFLARVHPARLALWSFLAALAHGAGLMLVPIFLGICGFEQQDVGHEAAQTLMTSNIRLAFLVAAVHTVAMTSAGAVIAVFIYLWLGLKFLSKTWLNLDVVWALSLVCVGFFGIYSALYGH
ncbi:hypothetical protein [Marivita hallyeonensis]|uniref:HupE / UreJ protein n=1 Tax=Marivita hallyeonensis TaxID=996342 RepID=A0A1M5LM55_9RHOB|nr:hypothetical protein [Marivita hallyeonensis]SHG66141.1 hypothetical protein SAMN05443551_0211 [Marivita hallyeonensis]